MSQHEEPTHATTGPTATSSRLPATLRLGALHLTVTDLDRSVDFYEDAIGLRLHRREDSLAVMGTGGRRICSFSMRSLAHGVPGATRASTTTRCCSPLAGSWRAALRLAETETPTQGASDHGTHEAIYLPDPDGNGIELAADRPRELWPRPLEYTGGPHPLDLDGLLAAIAGEERRGKADPGMVIGHVHLHVGDLERGLAFYRDVLGFELMTFMPGAAAFVSAGGYHHHLGFNIWRGEGIPPVPEGRLGLRHWTVMLDYPEEVEAVRERVRAAGIEVEDGGQGFLVRDPWDIAMVFTRT